MSQFYKTSLFYSFMRVYTNFIYKRWYSTIEINGDINIPEGGPVIFAPNHQNAFIDAMALLSSSPRPVVFWVRADIFSNKIIDSILRSLKMMPAYRMRNGYSNLKKNQESMSDSDDVLLHDEFLCLMPEGGQEEYRSLRPLVKGIFRSAFSAQSKITDKNKWVKIIPVGIDYGHYDKSGRHLIVNFGKPISIKDYAQLHEENAPVALNKIKEELARRMEPLMLNIKSKDHYDTFYTAACLHNQTMLNLLNLPDNETSRLVARQKIVEILDKAETDERCTEYIQQLEDLCQKWSKDHPDVSFSGRMQEFGKSIDANLVADILYLILFSWLLIYSLAINGIGYAICKLLGKKMRGTGFESSVKFGSAGLLMPIIYIIETIIAAFFFKDFIHTVAFFFTLPISFSFMLRYKWRFERVKERLRNIIKKSPYPSSISTIMQQIISTIGLQ
ncbi:MAG: 1-acyl-sn-glycerol-3-phosphate acyltransferase [Paludibacteraceae bacterium]|nr:1-acyl-sn-glycerol-3-phosphate acyltransferase [Paludibacteraceae bacterium]MBR5973057.1 1-acyl-sn-glycerol-3-phosphate acyltransferase [Paludibacteraceae bacterium]